MPAARRILKPRRNRAVELAMKEIDNDNRQGLLECLRAGLQHIHGKYGLHSYEARSAERMIHLLETSA